MCASSYTLLFVYYNCVLYMQVYKRAYIQKLQHCLLDLDEEYVCTCMLTQLYLCILKVFAEHIFISLNSGSFCQQDSAYKYH